MEIVFMYINFSLMLQVIYTIVHFLLSCSAGETAALETVDITNCDDQTRDGSLIRVNYQEINSRCKCIIKTHFSGILQLTSTRHNSVKSNECSSEIHIFYMKNDSKVLKLSCRGGSRRKSTTLSVSKNSTLVMRPEYIDFTNAGIYQEIKIFEEKSYTGRISVTCGNFFSVSSSPTIAADVHVNTITGNNPSTVVTDDTNIQNDKLKTDSSYIQTASKALTFDTITRNDSINTDATKPPTVDTTIQNDYMKTKINFKTSSKDTTSKAGTAGDNRKSRPTSTSLPVDITIQNDYMKTDFNFKTSLSTTLKAGTPSDNRKSHRKSTSLLVDTTIQNDYLKTDVNFKRSHNTTSKAGTDSDNTKSHLTSKSITVDITIQIDYIRTEINVKTSPSTTTIAGKANDNMKSDPTSTYIICGITGAAVLIILGIICIVIWCFRRRQSVPDNRLDQPQNVTYDVELPDNPLYHSYQPLENSERIKRTRWSRDFFDE